MTMTTAAALRQAHPAFFPLLHAADKTCDSATVCGNGYLYQFGDGSALRLSTQHVEVVEPTIPLAPDYGPRGAELARYAPSGNAMVPHREGRWVVAAAAARLLEAERARAQQLVMELERIANAKPHMHQFAGWAQNHARKAIEDYTGAPYPARLQEADHG